MTKLTPTIKMTIRRGDLVRVLRGKDRGKQGRVLASLPQAARVLVENVNMVKKHVKPKRAGEKGQRVVVAAPIHVASVQLVCPSCNKGTRIGRRRTPEGVLERVCKQCDEVIPSKFKN